MRVRQSSWSWNCDSLLAVRGGVVRIVLAATRLCRCALPWADLFRPFGAGDTVESDGSVEADEAVEAVEADEADEADEPDEPDEPEVVGSGLSRVPRCDFW